MNENLGQKNFSFAKAFKTGVGLNCHHERLVFNPNE
jgi:hypothetical protein